MIRWYSHLLLPHGQRRIYRDSVCCFTYYDGYSISYCVGPEPEADQPLGIHAVAVAAGKGGRIEPFCLEEAFSRASDMQFKSFGNEQLIELFDRAIGSSLYCIDLRLWKRCVKWSHICGTTGDNHRCGEPANARAEVCQADQSVLRYRSSLRCRILPGRRYRCAPHPDRESDLPHALPTQRPEHRLEHRHHAERR